MSEPFVAEIKIFAGNFAPRGYAFCNGQLLPIAQNTALFSLIGTTYGGDGRSTTALPNLQGRAAMHPGRGPGLTDRRLGERVGVTSVTLSEAQMPQHNHVMQGFPSAEVANPTSTRGLGNAPIYGSPAAGTLGDLAAAAIGNTGGNQSHNNMQPYLAMNFIIALQGIYPPRS
ncbi:MAG: phage tail protein [Gammaproteobacteria bacterium]|nr:phage tail protein [Gammaproteobacteria bacterium]